MGGWCLRCSLLPRQWRGPAACHGHRHCHWHGHHPGRIGCMRRVRSLRLGPERSCWVARGWSLLTRKSWLCMRGDRIRSWLLRSCCWLRGLGRALCPSVQKLAVGPPPALAPLEVGALGCGAVCRIRMEVSAPVGQKSTPFSCCKCYVLHPCDTECRQAFMPEHALCRDHVNWALLLPNARQASGHHELGPQGLSKQGCIVHGEGGQSTLSPIGTGPGGDIDIQSAGRGVPDFPVRHSFWRKGERPAKARSLCTECRGPQVGETNALINKTHASLTSETKLGRARDTAQPKGTSEGCACDLGTFGLIDRAWLSVSSQSKAMRLSRS